MIEVGSFIGMAAMIGDGVRIKGCFYPEPRFDSRYIPSIGCTDNSGW